MRDIIIGDLPDELVELAEAQFLADGGRHDSLELRALENRVAAESNAGDEQLGVRQGRRGRCALLFNRRGNLRLDVEVLLLLLLFRLALLLKENAGCIPVKRLCGADRDGDQKRTGESG